MSNKVKSSNEQINTSVSSETNDNIDSFDNNEFMLTTLDNPYDPFKQFNEWFMFDIEKGYNSCSYLARIIQTSDDMSQVEIDMETERAIDEIIKYDFMNIYKKVKRNRSDNE